MGTRRTMSGIVLKLPLSASQEKALAALEHEERVAIALEQPIGDVPDMDRRRVDATMEIARDIASIRIAALRARLQETVHD